MSDAFIPQGRKFTAIRPLNQGIRNDLPSTKMPPGSFTFLEGLIAQPYGLRRRPAVARYGNWTVDFPPIQGVWTCRAITGASFSILMDRRKIYVINPSAVTPLDYKYTTGTVSASSGGTTITGVGTAWDTSSNWILPGDRIRITGDTGTTNETNNGGTDIKTYVIASVDSATQVTIESDRPITSGFNPSGATYEIYRSVGASSIATPVNVNDTIYFTDGQRPIQTVTSTAWGLLNSDTYTPYAIVYFGDRLWVADIDDPHDALGGGAVRYRQRIHWSNLGVGNLGTFTNATDFINLPYGFGAIRRLLPMSQFLVAYFTDSIWIGQTTNLPSLPLEFTKFETGGMGIITPNAVTPFFDGHFFVGQDDIYFLTQRGVEAVGTPVTRDMLNRISSVSEVRAATDYSTSSIVFGIPTSGNQIEEIWRFNYRTKAWSMEERETDFIATDTILETITWDTLDTVVSPDEWGGFIYHTTWDGIITEAAWNQQLFFSSNDELHYYLDDGGTSDSDTGQTPVVQATTGDYDLDLPDTKKIWTKFSLELDEPTGPSDDTLQFTLEGSVDKGKNWKTLGTLSVESEEDEAAVNFRLSGAAARFRLTQVGGADVEPYTIGGFGFSFKAIGPEVQSRSNP